GLGAIDDDYLTTLFLEDVSMKRFRSMFKRWLRRVTFVDYQVCVLEARVFALENLAIDLAEKLGIEEIDGHPLGDWLAFDGDEKFAKFIERIESSDPGRAARLQAIVDGDE